MEKLKDVLTEENRVLVLDDNSTYTEGVNDFFFKYNLIKQEIPDIIEYIYINEISYISNNIPRNFNYILPPF